MVYALFITFFISLYLIFFSLLLIHIFDSVTTKIQYIRTRSSAIPQIMEALELKSEDTFFDLGSGDGQILRAAQRQNRNIQCVGFEIEHIPYLLSMILSHKNKNIDIRKKDFIDAPFADATKIYCYLGHDTMNILEPLFSKQCKTGTILVSCDFALPTKKPVRVISVEQKNRQLTKVLFVYHF